MPDDQRDLLGRRRTPTKAQRAIESALTYGSNPPPRATTESDGTIAEPTDPRLDRSTPIALEGPGLGPTLARIEERQRDQFQRDLASAKVLGDMRIAQVQGNERLGALVGLLTKADEREDKRDERASKERSEGRSSRKEIILAVIAAVSMIGAGYAYSTRPSSAPAYVAPVPMPMPTPTAPVQR